MAQPIELEGELILWTSEGGFAPSGIEIGGVSIEAWLAEHLDIHVTDRGNAEPGTYGRIRLTLELCP